MKIYIILGHNYGPPTILCACKNKEQADKQLEVIERCKSGWCEIEVHEVEAEE